MGRKLTVTLGIALLTFVLAPMASADEINTPGGFLIVPDGSQVTSLFPVVGSIEQAYQVDFQFIGGTGSNRGDFEDGDVTNIMFTVPVTNLSFTALLNGQNGQIGTDSGFGFQCSDAYFPPAPPTCGEFSFTLGGPISSLDVATGDGEAGVESLSFTVDAGDPPTSSLIFLGVGLIGLLVSSRRKVPSDCEADPLRSK
jgi:hypothetical protein